MPSSVAEVFSAARLQPSGLVTWGVRPPERGPGVYVVALTTLHATVDGVLAEAPVSVALAGQLLNTRRELRIDRHRPTAVELAERVAAFWLPDEAVVYIGRAGSSVASRVSAYYRTPLGARRPHAGGWFLKLLHAVELHVHFAASDDPGAAEDAMLARFCTNVSARTLAALRDPAHPFPFANLEWPQGVRKGHGITGARGVLPGVVPLSSNE